MICKHKSKLNSSKYCYVSEAFQLNSYLFTHSSISNNSIYNKSFVCTQFKISNSSVRTIDRPYPVPPLRARVDLEAMAMKRYSAFSQAQALHEPLHQIV